MIDKQIETIFKKALEGHELPYDPSAWNSLNDRLNQNSLAGRTKTWRWILGSIAIIIICSLAIWKSASSTSKKEIVKEIKQTSSISKSNLEGNKKSGDKNSQQIETNQQNKKAEEMPKNLSVSNQKGSEKLFSEETIIENLDLRLNENNFIETPEAKSNVSEQPIKEKKIDDNKNASGENASFSIPSMTFNCVGDQKVIVNNNDIDIVLLSPSNIKSTILANGKLQVLIEEKGYYRIGTMTTDGNFTEYGKQFVNDSPAIELMTEDLNYLNGLPALPLSIKTSEMIFTLFVNNKEVQTNNKKDLEVYLFQKGINQIKVCASSDLGCKTTISKTISIENDYNLLAVNAFDPFSSDNRKSTFMPYALLKRNTPFTMIVIDPSDGSIVFSSSDANNAWDGNDKRNGKMVPPNKAYIWKVTITNPEQKEKQEYKGTIVRL